MERITNQNEYDEENGASRELVSIADLMSARMPVASQKAVRGGINSPFNDAVGKVIEFMGEAHKPFGYWCGRLRGVPTQTIYSWLSKANDRNVKNPRSMFNWYLKDFRTKEKEAKVIHTNPVQHA